MFSGPTIKQTVCLYMHLQFSSWFTNSKQHQLYFNSNLFAVLLVHNTIIHFKLFTASIRNSTSKYVDDDDFVSMSLSTIQISGLLMVNIFIFMHFNFIISEKKPP